MSFRPRPTTIDELASLAPIQDERPSAASPDAPPTIAFNLRLNEYAHGLLTRVAKAQRRSKQSAAQAILVPALERAIAELEQSRSGAITALGKREG